MAEDITRDGHYIYDFITAKNLDGIRSLLNPLTLNHRRSIVCQTICNKTILGYACELRSRDIVKYLLDECEADIAKRFLHRDIWLSPLRISIENLDVGMFLLLKSRRAFTVDRPEATTCTWQTLRKQYLSLCSVLTNYRDNIESLNEFLVISNLLPMLTCENLDYTNPYLNASVSGDIERMKTSLEHFIDPKANTDSEENALCMTIWNDRKNAEYFLLNHRIFTLNDHVRALELCGAKLIAFRSELELGMRYWRKSIKIRNEHFLGVSDKFDIKHETGLGSEFTCEEQLDIIKNDECNIYVQAVIVFSRVLSPTNPYFQHAFDIAARRHIVENNLFKAFEILGALSELPYFFNSNILSPAIVAFTSFEFMVLTHFTSNQANIRGIFRAFRRILFFIKGVNWRVLLKRPGEFHSVVYINLLRYLIYKMIALSTPPRNLRIQHFIEAGIVRILGWNSYPFPTTLLHIASEEPSAHPLLNFLISCSHDVNCTDHNKNTPMHMLAYVSEDNDILCTMNLFVDAGGHIDAVNKLGISPLMILKHNGLIGNPLKFLSLKCLAAQAVHENRISVPEDFPQALASFIKLHTK